VAQNSVVGVVLVDMDLDMNFTHFFLFSFAALGLEIKALHLLGRCPTS
jgi:hypothetical protein